MSGIIGLFIVILYYAITGFAVMLLWNILAIILGFKLITLGAGIAVSIITSIIFS